MRRTTLAVIAALLAAIVSFWVTGGYVNAQPPTKCIIFFDGGYLKIGIRNNCDTCQTAVVYWLANYGGKDHEAKYQLPARSSKIVPNEGYRGTLTGEEPCK